MGKPMYCIYCRSTGKDDGMPCMSCDGSGYIDTKKEESTMTAAKDTITCPTMQAFQRIASMARCGAGEANYERYVEVERDILTVQHVLINADLASQPVDVEAIKKEFKAAFRGDTSGAMLRDISKRIDRGIDHLHAKGMLKGAE